jgi:O-antigen/teichoic acid export membrane protein
MLRHALAFLTNVILARLLSPNDFGLVAMAAVMLGFMELFKDLGTGSAVIQRKEISEELLSSIFWINAGFGLIFAAGLYCVSPALGVFYREPGVVPLMQVMSLSFFVSALSIVQYNLLSREMAFKRQSKIELVTALFSSVGSVSMASAGFGVMTLVYQPLLNAVLTLALLWGASTWRPKWEFHWREVRQVAGYSLNLTGFNVLNYIARNADNLLIGRYLGAQDLGYYDLAYRLMLYPLQSISAVVSKVMFPLYSKIQDDLLRFRSTYLTVAGSIALISFPLMLGLLAVSQPFVLALFGERWQPVVPLLMIFAPIGAIQSINTTVGSIYLATGRTDVMMLAGSGFSVVVMLAFAIGLQWGIIGVAAAYVIAYSILFIPSFYIAFQLIDLRLSDLVKVLWRTLLCSIIMCAVVLVSQKTVADLLPHYWPQWVVLGVLVVLGMGMYLALTRLMNRERFIAVMAALKNKP